MKTITSMLIALFLNGLSAQNTISKSDFENLDKTSWRGNLMYVNYGDGKEVNLRTTMQIEVAGNEFTMKTQYTDEPSANGEGSIKISADGTYLGEEKIVEKIALDGGGLKLVTRYTGSDNNRAAIMTKTYLITNSSFSITKEVSYEDSKEVLVRNRYTYTKL